MYILASVNQTFDNKTGGWLGICLNYLNFERFHVNFFLTFTSNIIIPLSIKQCE